MNHGLMMLLASSAQATPGFFASPSGVVILAVVTALAITFATYVLRAVPKQLMVQLQVRDALLGNKDHKQPGLIEDVAALKRAFGDHLEQRQAEMTGIHEDISGIHHDLALIKDIVLPTRRRRRSR